MLAPVTERQKRFPEWVPRRLDQMLDAAAAEFPDRPLVVSDERTVTYREIQEWSVRIAAGLAAAGVRPGEHVALVMANHAEAELLRRHARHLVHARLAGGVAEVVGAWVTGVILPVDGGIWTTLQVPHPRPTAASGLLGGQGPEAELLDLARRGLRELVHQQPAGRRAEVSPSVVDGLADLVVDRTGGDVVLELLQGHRRIRAAPAAQRHHRGAGVCSNRVRSRVGPATRWTSPGAGTISSACPIFVRKPGPISAPDSTSHHVEAFTVALSTARTTAYADATRVRTSRASGLSKRNISTAAGG